MRVLVAEDDARIASFLARGLEEAGYVTDTVGTGTEALSFATTYTYDVILLDIMLPGMDGINVCRELRRGGCRSPVLILTARSAVDDRVAGLDAGADDYMAKPFSFSELLARIRALLRRPHEMASERLEVCDLTIDRTTRAVERSGKRIDLTAREYSLLEYLARNKGQVLTRTQIAEHVWNLDFDSGTNIVDVYIRYLRLKVDTDGTRKLIHTVRGAGYRLDGGEAD